MTATLMEIADYARRLNNSNKDGNLMDYEFTMLCTKNVNAKQSMLQTAGKYFLFPRFMYENESNSDTRTIDIHKTN